MEFLIKAAFRNLNRVCLAFFIFIQPYSNVWSEGSSVVLPPSYKSTEDDGYSGVLGTKIRLMEVYSSNFFPPGQHLIREIRFRRDAVQEPFSAEIADLKISLSTTTAPTEELSSTFVDNIGPDETVVFRGPIQIQSTTPFEGDSPAPFEIVIPFSEIFTYDPSKGNLLIDIQNFSGSTTLWVDSENESGNGASRIFSYTPDSITARYSDEGADIIQLVLNNDVPDPGQEGELVIPPGFEAVEDDGFSGIFSDRLRLQEVYSSRFFSPGLIAITHLRFRRDGPSMPFEQTIPSYQVSMSATAKPPGGLSRTYAENIGSNETVVFKGMLEIESTNNDNPGGPHPFELTIPLDSPFYYNPIEGNLLIDIRNEENFQIPDVDASNEFDDNASRVFGYQVDSDRASFSDTGADIIQLEFQPLGVTLGQVSEISFNPQTGLFEQTIGVDDIPVTAVGALRVYILDLTDGVQIYNASGEQNGLPFIEFDLSQGDDEALSFLLEYYRASREDFESPAFAIGINAGFQTQTQEGERIQISRVFAVSNNRIGVEFNSVPGMKYLVEYSDDFEQWWSVSSRITAAGNRVQWLDDGPPKTRSKPNDANSRFYRIVELSN